MNGVHDLGGMHGFGPVDVNEPPPSFDWWESAVLAMSRGVRATDLVNLDEFRHAIERMEPWHYLESSYYEHWLDALERLLTEKDLVTPEQIEQRAAYFDRHPEGAPTDAMEGEPGPLRPELPRPTFVRPETDSPRFQPGDAVRARVVHPKGHTRLPRYVRGKPGTIERYHGVHVFPDAHAHGQGEQPQPIYSVRFDAVELWGASAEQREAVYLDLWESYLEPA